MLNFLFGREPIPGGQPTDSRALQEERIHRVWRTGQQLLEQCRLTPVRTQIATVKQCLAAALDHHRVRVVCRMVHKERCDPKGSYIERHSVGQMALGLES